MSVTHEETKDIPLIYPLISVTMRTVAYVNGRPIDSEGEEIFNMDQLTPREAAARLVSMLSDFEAYVSKVVETANSPEAQKDLQRILDENARPAQPPSANPPSSPALAEDQGVTAVPSGSPAA